MVEIEKRSQNEFAVVVEGKGGKTQHLVTLNDNYYHLLTQGKIAKEDLIGKSFRFLLEREPKESILSTFNLQMIKQYFPEFEKEVTEV